MSDELSMYVQNVLHNIFMTVGWLSLMFFAVASILGLWALILNFTAIIASMLLVAFLVFCALYYLYCTYKK